MIPVQSAGGYDEEDAVDEHEKKNGEMEVNTLSSVFKEAFVHPNIWHRQIFGLLHHGVRHQDRQGQQKAPAPGHTGVDHVLQIC